VPTVAADVGPAQATPKPTPDGISGVNAIQTELLLLTQLEELVFDLYKFPASPNPTGETAIENARVFGRLIAQRVSEGRVPVPWLAELPALEIRRLRVE
jgi:hypothetical protein